MEAVNPTTRPFHVQLGPYEGGLGAPLRVDFSLRGERVSECEIESGFLHRGIEKMIERQPWSSAVVFADRLDAENSAFAELAYCLSVEKILKKEASPRSMAIRRILCELTRVSSHLMATIRLASSVGCETVVQYLLRDRERLLDLFELISGTRFCLNYFRIGGVAADITDGFLERVIEVCHSLEKRTREYAEMLTDNETFRRRTNQSGFLALEKAQTYGITGPNARASGWGWDVRKVAPYSGYVASEFGAIPEALPAELLGSSFSRHWMRQWEIRQSLRLIRKDAEAIPLATEEQKEAPKKIPRGEAYVAVESPRGVLGCYVVSDGGEKPNRVQFRTPSAAVIAALPDIFEGAAMEDLIPIYMSLDVCVSEGDK